MKVNPKYLPYIEAALTDAIVYNENRVLNSTNTVYAERFVTLIRDYETVLRHIVAILHTKEEQ